MTYSATYDPTENKLRLYASSRLDAETYARVKAAGFRWAPKQDLFVAPIWTPEREDLLIELAGEVGDEDTSLVDRAEERAERFDDYRESRIKDAQNASAAVDRIADGIPMGQPILVGHHSERHARKDQERIENGMRKSIKMWETASYWQARAAGAIRHAKYKELPGVRHRRIKGIESDLRKQQKYLIDAQERIVDWTSVRDEQDAQNKYAAAYKLANYGSDFRMPAKDGDDDRFKNQCSAYDALTNHHPSLYAPRTIDEVIDRALQVYPASIPRHQRWIAHYENRIAYEKAMLGESGGIAAEAGGFDFQPGGKLLARYNEWLVVLKVNKKDGVVCSVSTTPPRFWGGRRYVAPIEEIRDYKPPTVEDNATVVAATKIAPMCNYPGEGFATCTQAQWKAIHVDYRGSETIAADSSGRHRVRKAHGVYLQRPEPKTPFKNETDRDNYRHHYFNVFITDAKRIDPPSAPLVAEPAPVLAAVAVPPPEPRTYVERERDERIPTHSAMSALKQAAKEGVKVVVVPSLFPTPPHLAARMVELAEIEPGHAVLEPSAGTGAIIDALLAAGHSLDPNHLCANEINRSACDILAARFPGLGLNHADFLEWVTLRREVRFDRVVMNPPFSGNQDIKHVRAAFDLLRDDGRLVAIMSPHWVFASDKESRAFRAWFEERGGTSEQLPPGTFKESGTMVNSVLVVIDR